MERQTRQLTIIVTDKTSGVTHYLNPIFSDALDTSLQHVEDCSFIDWDNCDITNDFLTKEEIYFKKNRKWLWKKEMNQIRKNRIDKSKKLITIRPEGIKETIKETLKETLKEEE